MNLLTQVLDLLPKRRTRQIPVVVFLMIVGAGFEVMGIGLIIPLIKLISGEGVSVEIVALISNFDILSNQDPILLGISIFASIFVLKGL